ncbi:MAG TPA: hypothetical protein VGM19_08245 [Armatimonadota bacterium]
MSVFRLGPSRGATLISTVVALGLLTMCLSVALRGYLQGSRAELAQERRLAAVGACQEQIERLRLAGAPGLGERAFAVAGQASLAGTLAVTAGPVGGTRQLTATVHWPADELAPAGTVSLTAIVAGGGGG